jgi:hypothetical protein
VSKKPENSFRESVHGYFDPDALHHDKMSNPYRAGGADDWYSGRGRKSRDLWIEWKFIVVPVRDDTLVNLTAGKKPPLSALQQHWLRERHAEGRNVWVGIGSAKGGILLPGLAWEKPFSAGEFRSILLSRKELAAQIVQFVQGSS